MTIGQITRTILTKLDWFDTLFPRIPVPVQKIVDEKLRVSILLHVNGSFFYQFAYF